MIRGRPEKVRTNPAPPPGYDPVSAWRARIETLPLTTKEHFSKHVREIASIRKLVLTGMKMLNNLAASQRETDRQLQVLVRSLQRGGNGHVKRPLG